MCLLPKVKPTNGATVVSNANATLSPRPALLTKKQNLVCKQQCGTLRKKGA